ncbi:Phospholipase A2 [Porites harrisoni]
MDRMENSLRFRDLFSPNMFGSCPLFFLLLVLSLISEAASWRDLEQESKFTSKDSKDAPMVTTSRSIVGFGLMILCHVHRNPLLYNGYGCYCGFGGKGKPLDQTDRCCQIHDECYNSVIRSDSCPFDKAVYVMPYSRVGCFRCKPASYYWFYGKCRHSLCKCDSEAVQCFKRSKFNPRFINYPQDKC